MEEEWKDIPGHLGYQASTLGRIRSLPREVKYKGGWISNKNGRILKPSPYRGGYLHLQLGRSSKNRKVHRLVALTFLPNPDNLPEVNHKNFIKTDNSLGNLEWVSSKQNVRHCLDHYGGRLYKGKGVIGTKDNDVIRFVNSIEAKQYGFNPSAIRNCISGIAMTHQGYTWRHDVKSKEERQQRKIK